MALSVDLEAITIASHTPDGAVEIDMSLTGCARARTRDRARLASARSTAPCAVSTRARARGSRLARCVDAFVSHSSRMRRLLGCGAHGIVRLGRVLETGELVAVKVSPLATSGKSSLKELTVLTMLPAHAHVVGVRSAQVNVVDGSLYLVLELCPGGELFDRIAEVGGLPEAEAKASFVQILAAIVHCHAGGVFHRDLKPENILLDADNRVKVADFGLASVRAREVASAAFLEHTACGSVMYAAPELHRDAEEDKASGEGYDPEKADIWSLGIVLYCMLTARLPFAVAHPQLCARYAQALADGFTIMCPETLSEQAVDILNAMLATDPLRRPSARELMAHAWLDGVRLPDAPAAAAEQRRVAPEPAPPKWSEYTTFVLGPDGGQETRFGLRKRSASSAWDERSPASAATLLDDERSDASHCADECSCITPPAPACQQPAGAAAGKRLRLNGGAEPPSVGMPDLVRHLGWEQLDASAVELLESVIKALGTGSQPPPRQHAPTPRARVRALSRARPERSRVAAHASALLSRLRPRPLSARRPAGAQVHRRPQDVVCQLAAHRRAQPHVGCERRRHGRLRATGPGQFRDAARGGDDPDHAERAQRRGRGPARHQLHPERRLHDRVPLALQGLAQGDGRGHLLGRADQHVHGAGARVACTPAVYACRRKPRITSESACGTDIGPARARAPSRLHQRNRLPPASARQRALRSYNVCDAM